MQENAKVPLTVATLLFLSTLSCLSAAAVEHATPDNDITNVHSLPARSKRDLDTGEGQYDKRLRDFVGKRDGDVEKRLREFVGKRATPSFFTFATSPLHYQKRLREFVGKRDLHGYMSKRLRDFVGKRSADKRLRDFVGKRGGEFENGLSFAERYNGDGETYEKRVRDFVGKRHALDSAFDKRLRDFVGKRGFYPTFDEENNESAEQDLQNPMIYFVGNRPGDAGVFPLYGASYSLEEDGEGGKYRMDKRLRDFVGKRYAPSGMPMWIVHDNLEFGDDESQEADQLPDKRLRDFVGKRQDKRLREFVGKRDEVDKRLRDFVGKRDVDEEESNDGVDKRLRDFVGKREDDGVNKRLREFVGKRDEVDKRLRDFVGKRDGDENVDKRLRDFVGKREDGDNVDKRLRDFVGKR